LPDRLVVAGAPHFGLYVHTTLKVPNCDCRGPYHVDFLGASFVANPQVFALKNFRKINGQFFENGTIGNQYTPRPSLGSFHGSGRASVTSPWVAESRTHGSPRYLHTASSRMAFGN
jgi:hypothetical protein